MMFHHRSRRIRDGLAVVVLVMAMLGAGSPAALAAGTTSALSDKGSGTAIAGCAAEETAPPTGAAERPWTRMLPVAR